MKGPVPIQDAMNEVFALLDQRSARAEEIAHGLSHHFYLPDDDQELTVVEQELPASSREPLGDCTICDGSGLRRILIDDVWTRLLCDCDAADQWTIDGDRRLTSRYRDVVPRGGSDVAADPPPRYEAVEEALPVEPLTPGQGAIWDGPIGPPLTDDQIQAAMHPAREYGDI